MKCLDSLGAKYSFINDCKIDISLHAKQYYFLYQYFILLKNHFNNFSTPFSTGYAATASNAFQCRTALISNDISLSVKNRAAASIRVMGYSWIQLENQV